ncbi:E3 ubiquitin-protein ligase SIAH2-like [Carcharodon carcharias]|uniref:E3 ubiquitin-protein ligase SIAH2-like n=1 Tax=Carcharodon carcharias TaxID=13397 RepID=UPI001B7E233E|nr:E3 ubiquitin-protein ligase SIAH2-like [Carcharodon carcharias]
MLFFTHCFGFVLDLVHFRYQYCKAKTAFSAAVQLVCVVRPTRSLTHLAARSTLSLHQKATGNGEDVGERHMLSCPCPGASCKWEGPLKAILPHLAISHRSIAILRGESVVFLATGIHLPGVAGWVTVQSCLGHHFVLVLEKQERREGRQRFLLFVLLLGTSRQAEGFSYRLVLNRNRRRLTWEATPRGLTEGPASVRSNTDSLVFDTVIAQLFADNGSLAINVTISTC